jgi:S-adenosylmethionine hydrolase
MALVTLTSDFGTTDPFVGIMKGVLAGRAPGVPVIDVTHGIPPQDVRAGALVLRQAAPWFPPGTIHVAVVDPGVGSARRPLCVATARACYVGPDNGILSLAVEAEGIRTVVELTEPRFLLSPRSATFHGRDVFAPVAAALAMGLPPAALGPVVTDMTRLALPEPTAAAGELRGEVVYVDHFGNLVTNVRASALVGFSPAGVSVTIAGARVRGVAASYSSARPGEAVAVVNSWDLLEVAVRDGSARALLRAGVGDAVVVRAVPG